MNRIMKVVIAITAMTIITPVFADEDEHEHRDNKRHHHQEPWHDHDIHRFHEHDLDIWRSGHWIHGRHQDRFAWWWVAGGVWYPYQGRVYPYPDPYMPPEELITQQPPVATSPPMQSAPNQFWYYCSQPQGYYPYMPECQVPWQKVPAGVPPELQR